MTLFSSVFAHQFQCCCHGSRNKPISDSHMAHTILEFSEMLIITLEMKETSLLVFVLRVHLESIELMTEVIPVPLGLLPIVPLNWLHQSPICCQRTMSFCPCSQQDMWAIRSLYIDITAWILVIILSKHFPKKSGTKHS